MKTKTLNVGLCLVTLFASSIVFGQTEEKKSLNNTISLVYGPKTDSPFAISSNSTKDGNLYTISSKTQSSVFGLKLDHIVTDNFTMGVDVFFNSSKSTGELKNTASGEIKNAEYINSRLRILTRFTKTIKTKDPNFEMYFGGGIGYNKRFRTFNVENIRQSTLNSPSSLNIPICMRAYFGMRYTIYKNLGINAEWGLGGPLVSGGLHYKF